MNLFTLVAIGGFLLLLKKRSDQQAAARAAGQSTIKPTATPPAGWIWQQAMDGGWFLIRENDPLRFSID
jgi:hypothetical protein